MTVVRFYRSPIGKQKKTRLTLAIIFSYIRIGRITQILNFQQCVYFGSVHGLFKCKQMVTNSNEEIIRKMTRNGFLGYRPKYQVQWNPKSVCFSVNQIKATCCNKFVNWFAWHFKYSLRTRQMLAKVVRALRTYNYIADPFTCDGR